MNLMEHFEQLLSFDSWANREIVGSLRKLENPPARCVQLLAHIIGAEYLWFTRMVKESPRMAVWPELTVAQCEEQVTILPQTWRGYFAEYLPAGLTAQVQYKNSKGEPWSSAVQDILSHVFLHSTYHRGQIALEMRRAGHTPAYTDFIHGVRQGLLE